MKKFSEYLPLVFYLVAAVVVWFVIRAAVKALNKPKPDDVGQVLDSFGMNTSDGLPPGVMN